MAAAGPAVGVDDGARGVGHRPAVADTTPPPGRRVACASRGAPAVAAQPPPGHPRAVSPNRHRTWEVSMHGKMMNYLVVAGAAVIVGLLIAGTPVASLL